MNHRIVLAGTGCLAFVATLLAAGCSLAKPYPAKQTYLVEARRAGPSEKGTGSGILRVRGLQVAAPFEGKGFVYRTGDSEYRVDFYHEFLVPPRAVFTEQVRDWLGASGRFQLVTDGAGRLDASLQLEGNLSALYADYRDPSAIKAVLAIEFFLSHTRGENSEILFRKSYREEVPLESRAAEAVAKGWGRALSSVLQRLESELSAVPGR